MPSAEQLDYRFVRIATPVGALDIRAIPSAGTPNAPLFQVAVVRPRHGLRIVDADQPERSSAPFAINPVGVAKFRADGSPTEEWCSVSLRAIGLRSAQDIVAWAIARYIERSQTTQVNAELEDEVPSPAPRP